VWLESYWWSGLPFWHSVISSPYLTWQWIWRIWVWYCFLCRDFVTSWSDVISILAMHNGGLGCAWNGVISTWAMDMVDLDICLKWPPLNLKPFTMCTKGSTVSDISALEWSNRDGWTVDMNNFPLSPSSPAKHPFRSVAVLTNNPLALTYLQRY
jgi:hypothetical protein